MEDSASGKHSRRHSNTDSANFVPDKREPDGVCTKLSVRFDGVDLLKPLDARSRYTGGTVYQCHRQKPVYRRHGIIIDRVTNAANVKNALCI